MTIRAKTIAVIAMLTLLLYSCTKVQPIDEKAERAKIIELHNLQRTYHFDKMAEELVAQLSASHISVNRGEIKHSTPEENIKRFTSYFNAVEFEKWDDISPPIIKFSDDYSIAYTIVNKGVVLNYSDENGKKAQDHIEFSWVAIYKKYPDGWQIDCIASTNKPVVTVEI